MTILKYCHTVAFTPVLAQRGQPKSHDPSECLSCFACRRYAPDFPASQGLELKAVSKQKIFASKVERFSHSSMLGYMAASQCMP